jgi:predicted nucleic acid-binding protein
VVEVRKEFSGGVAAVDTNAMGYNWDGTERDDVKFRRRRIRDLLRDYSVQLAYCGLALFELAGVLGQFSFQPDHEKPEFDHSFKVRRRATESASQEALSLCREGFLYIRHNDFEDVEVASRLHADHGFEMKDGITIVAALRKSCKVLLSEDMQDGRVVRDRKGFGGGRSLKIVNPFYNKAK